MRTAAVLAVACLLVLAGCTYGYAGPTATESPESASSAPDTSTPTPTDRPSTGTPTAMPSPTPTPTPVEPGRIRVVGGRLPVDEVRVYDRTLRLLGTDVDGPERIRVRNLSAVAASEREGREFFRLMGLTREARPNDTDLGVAAYVAGPDVVNVNERAAETPTRLEYTLAHEYVHVVQFRTGAVTSARLATDVTLDGRLAWRATIEGAATYVEDVYWREYGSEGERPVAVVRDRYENASGSSRFAIAPYRFGAVYVDGRIETPANLSVVYRDPPRTTEQVLHPGVAEGPATLSATGVDGDDWLAVPGERRMGELFVRVALSTGVNASAARAGADGWGTDRRLDFVGPNGSQGFAWVLRFDDETNATEFERVMIDWLDARAERAGDCWRDGDAAYRLERVDDRTVVVYTGAPAFVREAAATRNSGVTVRPPG